MTCPLGEALHTRGFLAIGQSAQKPLHAPLISIVIETQSTSQRSNSGALSLAATAARVSLVSIVHFQERTSATLT
jgi:hypothetical protein